MTPSPVRPLRQAGAGRETTMVILPARVTA